MMAAGRPNNRPPDGNDSGVEKTSCHHSNNYCCQYSFLLTNMGHVVDIGQCPQSQEKHNKCSEFEQLEVGPVNNLPELEQLHIEHC